LELRVRDRTILSNASSMSKSTPPPSLAVYSKFDLKSAYHQVPISKDDMKFTTFEANCELYEYRCIPFGLTNAVPSFQCAMNRLVEEEHLKDTYPYLDDVTIGGRNKMEHDLNVKKFEDTCKKRHITLNHKKTI